MAFFGYDPFRGVSNLGSTIEQAGQQIGGMISSIPKLQQQEKMYEQQQRLGAQQERMGQLGIESQEFQMQKDREVHEQIKKNPGEIANIGKAFADKLREDLNSLPEHLQGSFEQFIDVFESSYKPYETMGHASNEQAEQARSKVINDFKATRDIFNMAKISTSTKAKTKEEFMSEVAEKYPQYLAQQLKETSKFQSLPGADKGIDALTKAKIGTEEAKRSKYLADIDKIRSELEGKSDKDSKFLAQRLDKIRTVESKAIKDLAEIDSKLSEIQRYMDAFEGNEMVQDPDTGQPMTDSKYQQYLRDLQILERQKEEIIKNRELWQQDLKELMSEGVEFGIQPESEVTAVDQVGKYPTNWTIDSSEPKKSRQRLLDKINKKYGSIISKVSSKHGVPEELITAIIAQESSGNPKAIGPQTKYGKAVGLGQILPSNLEKLKIPKNKWTDPNENINAMGILLSDWLKRYGDKGLETVIAAYNAGDVSVNKGTWKNWKETPDYVSKVRGNLEYLYSLKEPEAQPSSEDFAGPPKPSVDNTGNKPKQESARHLSPSQAASRIRAAWEEASPSEKEDIKRIAEAIKDPAVRLEIKDILNYNGFRDEIRSKMINPKPLN